MSAPAALAPLAPHAVVVAELSGGVRVPLLLPAHLGALLRDPVVLHEGAVVAVLFLAVDDELVAFAGRCAVARAAAAAWPAQLSGALLPAAPSSSGGVGSAFGWGVRVAVRMSALPRR